MTWRNGETWAQARQRYHRRRRALDVLLAVCTLGAYLACVLGAAGAIAWAVGAI